MLGSMRSFVEKVIFRLRWPLIVGVNLFVTAAGFYFALGARFDFDYSAALKFNHLSVLGILFAFRALAFSYWGLNQGYWKYASTQDLGNIIKAHIASSGCLAGAIYLFQVGGFPRSVIVIESALSIMFSGGMRLLVRNLCEKLFEEKELRDLASRHVVVLGAGDSGHLLVKMLQAQRRLGYKPVAVLDDSERLKGHQVYGVPVLGGIGRLNELIEGNPQISAVIVAIPSFSEKRFEEIKKTCGAAGVSVKRLQSFEDLACLDANTPKTSNSIEALLDCQVEVEHEEEIREVLCSKVALVTGAGGSIGSELMRQILLFNPAEIVAVDNCEYNLYKIQQELASKFPDIRKHFVLGSIADSSRLSKVFEKYRPEFVFHAAAYKHVPLLENNCYEAFRNNIIGTRNLLQCSVRFGVRKFVLISTDKAVAPSSVMGATKRICELLTKQSLTGAAREKFSSGEERGFSVAIVRFGNVINSTGSVIPLFKEQIISGGPVTVTHPDMERFFMSIREAVRLVLMAGTLGTRGEIYVLDMGKPIKIVDVAKKMLSLYGRRDIPIVFTGTRPGEKLTETLNDEHEEVAPTRFRKVNRSLSSAALAVNAFEWVAEHEDRIQAMTNTEVGELIKGFVQVIRVANDMALPEAAN